MKTIFTCVFYFIFFDLSYAANFYIHEINKVEGFELKYQLSSKISDHYSILDCQSFFSKFDFYNVQNQLVSESFIDIQECAYIYENVTSCLSESGYKCISVDGYYQDGCECGE